LISSSIRYANSKDQKKLLIFFSKAYGKKSVFTNPQFLEWYLLNNNNSAIIIGKNGEVQAHYGCLKYKISFKGTSYPMVWGVNAYTLPKYRGDGLGKKLFSFIMENKPFFGVIGFHPKICDFYRSQGFQVFNKRSKTFLKAFQVEFKEISRLISDRNELIEQVVIHKVKECQKLKIISKEPIKGFAKDINNSLITTIRDIEFLKWRYFSFRSPYQIHYITDKNSEITCALISRRVQLKPTLYFSTRIVDFFGDINQGERLLEYVEHLSFSKGDLYIDFSIFGEYWDELFRQKKYMELIESEVEIVPQYTSPLGKKANHEFVGLYSNDSQNNFYNLSQSDICFTRGDSDRDRFSKLDDLAPQII
jgi:hypothetical protein